ncbi:MAG: ABC transporter permease [Verrucomicrobia bacterium]|nr:ABC transporter permease [Verrucomicrobiota bacterium]
MRESWRRIRAVAANTFLEAVRQKVFAILLIFALVLLAGANYFAEFSFQEQFKFLKDLGYATISLTGLLVGLLGAAQLIPAEIERRTILTALCRPLRRWEFLAGKYLGLVSLLGVMLGIMAGVFWLVLRWKEMQLIAAEGGEAQMVAAIRGEARDPRLWQAFLLIGAKLFVISAIAIFFSTLATSTTFVVAMTLMIYLIGHLQSVAREQWLESGEKAGWALQTFLAAVAVLIPDFNLYSLIDEIVAGNAVRWPATLQVLGYSAAYVGVILVAAACLFEGRDL